ncbi:MULTISPECIES: AI-2E family transporter [unclassified Polaromonas]|jgi:predicted PurR-regulated permease PerM|uniref:AI-2E family transporter n=1 Tax=unclassified Polaromonas TaxID=2638319 RepID=UPI000BD254CF|nr:MULTISPECIES: AI-2E family transporter [unclassified Polaromonas]OYY36604.1 MAG: AI-2E family transporter [Polaromonas sp. 35-63-35]OYZ18757.1 MAG: AI-2E family transporter [Polaromonas sp. 16-63-31]OYZ80948.1 MAG: AI-2E family transporter [Polaromonas sp. 24-63-21]OZA52836.1 MAG: AI-2E family transporter [Polaromonas sp. 17-63-33]OZA88312.1 MAG: AI-2E family transporter [Polaromonas sp. 39-63-25]
MQFTSAQKRTAAWCLIAALVMLALWLLGPVLTPFVVGAVLAYVLTPVVNWLDGLGRGRMPRVLAVLIVETLFILVLLSILLLVVPIFAKELPLLREQLPLLADRVNNALGPWLAQFGITVALDVASIKAFVVKYLSANFEDAFGSVLSSLKLGGSVALAIVGNAVLIPVALFFLLKDWGRFVGLVVELVPPKLRASFDSFMDEADAVLGQYLRGQLLVMGVLAIYFSVALALFGFDLAVPVGVFTGLAFFIPYLGFGLGLVLALLAGVLQFGGLYGVLVVAGVYGAGQLVESLYLTPRLVGERIGLHPLAVIFALLAFGQLFGFLGVLIALPASAVLLVGIRRVRAGYMASKLYQG